MRPSACCGRATGRIPRHASPGRPRMPTCSSCCSIGRRTRPCDGRSSPTTLRSFMAFRVGLIGLGMAVTPHAKSLLDLSDRVEVAYAYSPSAERLRGLLAAGKLGELVSACASIPVWRPQSYYDQPGRGTRARDGGGVLLTQGIHTLDLFLSYTGPVEQVSSFVTTTPLHRMETEDLVCASLRFASGALGVVHATTAAYPGFLERIELIGTLGTATLEGTALKANFTNGKNLEVKTESGGGGTGADPMAFPHDWHRSLLADFIDAIERGREPRVNGEEALKVHRLIDRLLQSAG